MASTRQAPTPFLLVLLVTAGAALGQDLAKLKAVPELTPRQRTIFEAAKKKNEVLTWQVGACSCPVNQEFVCLSRKKGPSLEELRKQVEAAAAEQAKVKCAPNAGCSLGTMRSYFYCD